MENNQFDLAIILVFMVVGLFSFLKVLKNCTNEICTNETRITAGPCTYISQLTKYTGLYFQLVFNFPLMYTILQEDMYL